MAYATKEPRPVGLSRKTASAREQVEWFKKIANMDFFKIDATVSVTYIVSNSDTERKEK